MKALKTFFVLLLFTTSSYVYAYEQWDVYTTYERLNIVEYNQQVWIAKWWNSGETPLHSTAWSEFSPDSIGNWSSTAIYDNGDIVKHIDSYWMAAWWTQNETPGQTQAWDLLPIPLDGISIENLVNGEHVGYQLLLIRGTVQEAASSITATLNGDVRDWPVVDGKFKISVLLEEGVNQISLVANNGAEKLLTITWDKKPANKFVRLIYAVASDGDKTFQAPPGEPNDLANAKQRMAFAGLLLQTATAELMRNAGYGPKTFALARDENNHVIVEELNMGITMAEAHAMNGGQLYSQVGGFLNTFPDAANAKNLAYIQPARYIDGQPLAHTALGAGALALYSSLTLHTYAANLDELVTRFSDQRDVNDYALFPDFRVKFWENYATGVGASLHELGHCLELWEHPSDPDAVMNRGFERINRIFMVTEDGVPFSNENIKWVDEYAEKLNNSPWFN